jgi:hypothetical protein
MIKSRRMRWVRHVVCIGRGGIHTGFLLESQNETDHQEDTDIGGRIKLKLIIEK